MKASSTYVFEVGNELPVGSDLAQQHYFAWRIPQWDTAPHAFAYVRSTLEHASAIAGFDDYLNDL
jgi:hypothetical protein